jgi:hypothetical protein
MNLELKKFRKIVSFKKKYKLTDFDLINNYGLFSGDTNLFKTLTIYKLIEQVKDVKGDIIELGVHNGNTSLLIKKILDIFNIKKKLYLLDHFKGLINFQKKDTLLSKKHLGKYKGDKEKIKFFLNFFGLKNVKIISKDATSLKTAFFKKKLFSLAYFDMDLYLPTIKGLNAISKNMNKNSLIIFDQGLSKKWSERLAVKEFLKNNKNFSKIIINPKRQPSLILKKIKN